MTIADNYEPIKQETNGVATQFSFDFYALNETFIKVYLETDGVQTLVNSTDYEITFTENGGVVAFYDPPAAGSYIIITRDTPREQETPFYTSSGFPAKTVEGRLDKLTAMVQELQDDVDRSAKAPVGTNISPELPVPDEGKALVWDGNSLANSDETLQAISDKATGAYSYAQEAKGYRDQAIASATLAEEWATKMDAPVDDNEYSAKWYADSASGSAELADTAATAAQTAAASIKNGWDILDFKWSAKQLNDQSWLLSEGSWHNKTSYEQAYTHLEDDINNLPTRTFYGWMSGNPLDQDSYYTLSASPQAGDIIYKGTVPTGTPPHYTVGEVYATVASFSGGTITDTNSGTYLANGSPQETQELKAPDVDIISGHTIEYFVAADGDRIVVNADSSSVDGLYNDVGVDWYFVLDLVSQKFKLPRTTFGFVGYRDAVGKYVAPGLPNITGLFNLKTPFCNGSSASGALEATSQVVRTHADGGGSSGGGFTFDASRSNSIYGNSTTVQPPATQMYLYFYVGMYNQTATEQTAGLNAELFNGKADIDMSNVPSNIGTTAKSYFSGIGMPSDTYENLTLGSSGSTYTAPANGYVAICKMATRANQSVNISCNGMNSFAWSHVGSINIFAWLPVKKGDVFTVTYSAAGTHDANYFRFVYAEGEENV
jgi:hypothetical protein